MIIEIKIDGKKYRYDLEGTDGEKLSKGVQEIVKVICNNILVHLYRENVFFKKFMDNPKESVLEKQHTIIT